MRLPARSRRAHAEHKTTEHLMPLYEYACHACGTRTEVRHAITEPPPGSCAACGGPLERVFTPPSSPRRRWSPWATTDPSAPAKAE